MNFIRYFLGCMLIANSTLAAAGGLVVISSTLDSFGQGAIVEASQSIELGENQSLKLLSSSGKVINLIGPYDGPIDSSSEKGDSGLLDSLARVVTSADSQDLTLGVYRNISSAKNQVRGDIWGVEVGKAGNYCVPSESPIILWWPDAVEGIAVTITDTSNSASFEVQWTGRSKEILWPEHATFLEGNLYTTQNELSDMSREFTVSRIPVALGDEIEQIVWISENKCAAQAKRLLGEIIHR